MTRFDRLMFAFLWLLFAVSLVGGLAEWVFFDRTPWQGIGAAFVIAGVIGLTARVKGVPSWPWARRPPFLLLVLALAVMPASACSMMTQIAANSVGIPLENKVVAAKSEPNVLIATDGSACTVSKKRWEDAEVGKRYLCAWEASRGLR